jgi:Mce-associated membrane protein
MRKQLANHDEGPLREQDSAPTAIEADVRIKIRGMDEESGSHHDHTGKLPPLDAAECRDAPRGEDTTSKDAESDEIQLTQRKRATKQTRASRALAFGIMPAVALLLALAAGYLKWEDSSTRDDQVAGLEATQVAKEARWPC